MAPGKPCADLTRCFKDVSKAVTMEYEHIPVFVLSKLINQGYSPLVCQIDGAIKVCYQED